MTPSGAVIGEEIKMGENMSTKRFKPKYDKLFWLVWAPTALIMLIATALSFVELVAFLLMLATDIFTFYFLFSSVVAYAELREETLFIKYGFILKKEIPYSKIRGTEKARKWYSDSMLSLKNSLEHVNIKYNTFDFTSVSVKDNDAFIEELKTRIANLDINNRNNKNE